MMSREAIYGLAAKAPKLAPVDIPFTPEQLAALTAFIEALQRLHNARQDLVAEQGDDLSPTEQVAAVQARIEKLAPRVDDVEAAEEALAEAGVRVSPKPTDGDIAWFLPSKPRLWRGAAARERAE